MAFEFTRTSTTKINKLLKRYPTKQAALLPVLRVVEEQEDAISEDAMKVVAERLEVSPAFVYGVFTFYTHFRRPETGSYHVQLCSTLPCALVGCRQIEQVVRDELGIGPGETTEDGLFTFSKVECLGSCNTGPVAQINDEYHENLTPESIREVLKGLKEEA